MKKTNITTTIGTLELGNLTFDEDYMEVNIDICSISDSLNENIYKAIEARKIESVKEWKSVCLEKTTLAEMMNYKMYWSDVPVVIDYTYLKIRLKADEKIKYSIEIIFHDSKNQYLEENASVDVDLSEYQNELKKVIVKAMIDKFF